MVETRYAIRSVDSMQCEGYRDGGRRVRAMIGEYIGVYCVR